MSFRQLIAPRLTPDIFENDILQTDWYGWCLAYVQNAFELGWSGNTAWDAWLNHTVNKHSDTNLPTGVYVPIFFSGYGGQGHAAIYKDGQVFSSPWHHKADYDVMSSIEETARIYNVTFVGWAEGLAGKQVAEDSPSLIVASTYESSPERDLVVTRNPTNWYDLNYEIPIISNTLTIDSLFSVAGIAHHPNGKSYYMNPTDFSKVILGDYSSNNGIYDGDLQEIVVPTSVITPIPPALPAAPVTAKPVEKYKLLTTVMTFQTADDAKAEVNAKSILKEGSYIVFAKDGIAYNLTMDNMSEGVWINKLTNVISPPTTRLNPPELTTPIENPVGDPPTPVNWRGTLNLGYAGLFVFTQDTNVIDLEGKNPTKYAKNGDYLQISGKFTGPDGNEYARPKNSPNVFMWYGIPVSNLKPYNDVYGTQTTLQEREVLHTLTNKDRIDLWLAKIKVVGMDVWDIVAPKKRK